MQRDGRAQGDLGRGGRGVQRHVRAGRQPAAPLQDPASEILCLASFYLANNISTYDIAKRICKQQQHKILS